MSRTSIIPCPPGTDSAGSFELGPSARPVDEAREGVLRFDLPLDGGVGEDSRTFFRGGVSPLERDDFGGKARPERDEKPPVAGLRPPGRFLENQEHGGGRRVPPLAEDIPG